MESLVGKRKLQSEDNEIFEVDLKVIKKSDELNKLLNDYPEENQVIPCKTINGKDLKKILEFMEHYLDTKPKEIPKPLPSGNLKEILDEWDFQYIENISLENLEKLLNSANLIGLEDLVHIVSAKIAAEILNGTEEEMIEKFTDKSEDHTVLQG